MVNNTSAAQSGESQGRSSTVISAGVVLRGEIVCEDASVDVIVEGRVEGTVRVAGRVLVASGGTVVGSLRAPHVRIEGRVTRGAPTDAVVVDGDLVLAAGARLECDAVYEALNAERGAVLAGLMVPFESDYFHELHQASRLPMLERLPVVESPRPREVPVQRRDRFDAPLPADPGETAAAGAASLTFDGRARSAHVARTNLEFGPLDAEARAPAAGPAFADCTGASITRLADAASLRSVSIADPVAGVTDVSAPAPALTGT